MDLLKILAMPFQLASLLFVGLTALLMGFLIRLAGGSLGVVAVLAIFALWLLVVWLTNYALRLIDDAANGVHKAAVASAEMLADPFADSRCWVHPALAAILVLFHYAQPDLPTAPSLVVAALLFPASLGACVMSGHARDALNPVAIAGAMRGFGIWYVPLVLFTALCVALAVLATRTLPAGALVVAILEMLLLLAYAGIGGAVYMRRFELGFAPRVSPERRQEREQRERDAARQQFIDGMYKDLRVRETQRAIASAIARLKQVPAADLAEEMRDLLAAGRHWNEPREFPRLLRGLLPTLVELKQPALALGAADSALAVNADFAPPDEATTLALAEYALQTGRRRGATRMLENYLKASQSPASERLDALRARLAAPVQPPA
jgi:hypothetical protein